MPTEATCALISGRDIEGEAPLCFVDFQRPVPVDSFVHTTSRYVRGGWAPNRRRRLRDEVTWAASAAPFTGKPLAEQKSVQDAEEKKIDKAGPWPPFHFSLCRGLNSWCSFYRRCPPERI